MAEYATEDQAGRGAAPGRGTGGGSHRRAGNGRHRARTRSAAKPLLTVVAVAATAASAVVGSKVLFTSGPQDGRTAAAPDPSLPNGDVPLASSQTALPPVAPSPQNSASPTSLPSGSASTLAVQQSSTPTAAPSTPRTTAPSTPRATQAPTGKPGTGADLDAAANQVLALINQARAAQGVAPLQMLVGLQTSADAHNHTMAAGCGLSHQCPGEPAFGDRERAAGVKWGTAGENIGDGGPVANTTDAIAKMALGLTNSMLAEQPPNDGHRRNILNPAFHHVGIELLRDASGTVWMTQDFSD
ncbi:CAP domain-containing protein [Kitasatospora sp. NPDC048365]|uniref:CAP domain-containing protein n=1 Tax=Kitasatospora sp. NPDC048365 TaxID=3364050 RepID=UPI00370FDF6C